MGVFWFLIGGIVGVIGAWFYLGRQCQRQLADKDDDIARLRSDLAAAVAKQQVAAPQAAPVALHSEPESQPAHSDEEAGDVDEADADSSAETGGEQAMRDSDHSAENSSQTVEQAEAQPPRRPDDPGIAGSSPLDADSLNVLSDDLTRIKGIGPVLQVKLNNLGIVTFKQIADFTAADIDRVNNELDFSGRIERDNWVEQAKAFASRSGGLHAGD